MGHGKGKKEPKDVKDWQLYPVGIAMWVVFLVMVAHYL